MKVFERLILHHLKSITDPLLDPLQFAYRANRSVDDAVNIALRHVLKHLDTAGCYARIMFLDFSSAFNTIFPPILEYRLFVLQVPFSTCRWISDFLSNRTQRVKLGNSISKMKTISTGSPQGCVLSPYLFSIYTNCCTSSHESVKLLKFADDTTLVGLISRGNESHYRNEINSLVSWCARNNLELNALKTVEQIVDFRVSPPPPSPIILGDTPVTMVESCRFLGVTVSRDLKWGLHIDTLTKKAQKRMFFLRQLRKFNLPRTVLVNFYTAIIESVITLAITVWYPTALAKEKAKLQRVIRAAEKVIGCTLPPLESLFKGRALKKARKIMADSSHPAHSLFSLLPSGRRLRSLKAVKDRHKESFFPTVIRLLNDVGPPFPTPT